MTCDFAEVPLHLSFSPGSASEESVHRPPTCGQAQGLFGSQIPSSPGSRLDKKLHGDPSHRHFTSASSAGWIVGTAS